MLSIRRWLLGLVRPDTAFEDWRPSVRLVAIIVILLALVNAIGVYMAADSVAATVSGSVAVDNPARPSQATCEMVREGGLLVGTPEDSLFTNTTQSSAISAACENEPRMVQQQLAPIARNVASGMLFPAFFVTIVEWLLVGGIFALFVPSSDHGGFADLLTVAGWGTIPAVFRYAARPIFVERAAESWMAPKSIDALQSAARVFVSGEQSILFTVIVLVTLLWQALIYAYGFAGRTDAPFQRTATISGIFTVVLGSLFVLVDQLPAGELIGFGVLFLILGLPNVAIPYWLARLGERLDAIGNTRRWSDVEPAGWNVWVTRATGILLLTIAFWLLGGFLFV